MDWNQPALPAAVDYLVRHYHQPANNRLDLDQVLVVVPGSRAGRRLSQLLAARAGDLGAVLFPPRIQTAGHLPENLYQPKRPFADELTQSLAWVESLKSQRTRARKFFPHLPESRETIDWLDLASMLGRMHRELAAEGLDFGDVVEKGKQLQGFADTRRWRFLSSLQQGYLDVLDGLQLWDQQTARLFAIRQRECQSNDQIYLLGTPDLNGATRSMLDQVSENVVALVHASETEALGFDEYGCLEPYYWKERKIPLREEQVIVTDQPEDQANAVCHLVQQMGPELSTDQLVLGVPANEVALYIQRKFQNFGVATHWAIGPSLRDSGPAKLLEAICAAIELDRYPDYAALLRHPDIERWLRRLEDAKRPQAARRVISEADRYYGEHLVPRLGPWLGDRKKYSSFRWAVEAVQRLLKPLQKKQAALSGWAAPLLEITREVYRQVELDLESDQHASTIKTLVEIRNVLESFLNLPEALDLQTSPVHALRLLLQKLGQENASISPEVGSVELLGWLELPLDIATKVIVTGFNEGSIPESLNADMFLPNGLRKVLGLTDNQRRLARDAYAVTSMLHSKQEIRFIIGKRNVSGDPLTPSRLYFATDRETIASRVRIFSRPVEFVEPDRSEDVVSESGFFVPPPRLEEVKIESVSVTAFKTFLKCPYRFYLQSVLGLRAVDDRDLELPAMAFGNLLHELFRRFGESRLRYSESEKEICEFLEAELETVTLEQYGVSRLPAVEIQLQQVRHRLHGFARWQAERTRQGWEIRYVEKKTLDPQGVDFEFAPERSVKIRGTIDRIDFQEVSGTWQILDYKTGDRGESPGKTHQDRGQWVDLQLPLYRQIAKTFDVDGQVQLGYILVPKSAEDIGESIANWTSADLEEAIAVARECCRRIVDLEFWEPTSPPPPFVGQEFASICQDQVFEPRFGSPNGPGRKTAAGGAG
ncbi:MAG: PD-(D/E)XK nuclease family protein [Planctomycetota bacterium]|nr:PD-(D/E)XK nuclease family protein [Planctomycetota bacterium]